MSTKAKIWLVVIPAIITYVVFLAWFLAFFFKIKSVEDLPPMASIWSHWMFLVCATLSFLTSAGLGIYALVIAYRDAARYKDAKRTVAALEGNIESLKLKHAAEVHKLHTDENPLVLQYHSIKDAAIKDMHDAQARAAQCEAELSRLKKCYYCPPGDLPVTLTPTWVPSMEQFLIVTNKGTRQAFRAQAKLVGKNDEHILTFNLAWDADEVTRTLSPEESGKLQIARIWDDRKDLMTYIALREYSGGIMRDTQWNRLSTTNQSPEFPPYRLDILILGDSTECHSERFVLRPGGRGEPGMCMVREEKAETKTV